MEMELIPPEAFLKPFDDGQLSPNNTPDNDSFESQDGVESLHQPARDVVSTAMEVLQLRLQKDKLEEDKKALEKKVRICSKAARLNKPTERLDPGDSTQRKECPSHVPPPSHAPPPSHILSPSHAPAPSHAPPPSHAPHVSPPPHVSPIHEPPYGPPIQYVIAAPPSDQNPNSHLEELLRRQVEEIAHIKAKLASEESERKDSEIRFANFKLKTEEERQSLKDELQNQLLREQSNHRAQVERLEDQVGESKEMMDVMSTEHAQKLSDLQEMMSQKLSEHAQHVSDLKEEFDRETVNRIVQFERQLNEKDEFVTAAAVDLKNSEAQRKDLEKVCTDLEGKCAGLELSAAQSKSYLAQCQQRTEAMTDWEERKESALLKIKLLESEKDTLLEQNQHLQVRLDAAEDILSIQERIVTQESPHTADPADSGPPKELLMRWRQQVFKQLVLNKSAEIAHKKEVQSWIQKHKESELQRLSAQGEILSGTIAAKEAQLATAQGEITLLNSKMENLSRTIEILENQKQLAENSCKQMFTNVSLNQAEVDENLKTLNRRLQFAGNRITVVSAQVARKEARLAVKAKDLDDQITEWRDQQAKERESGEAQELRQEVARLANERELLAHQMREDACVLEEKITAIKEDVKQNVITLETENKGLKQLLEEKNEKLDGNQQKLSEYETLLDETTKRLDEVAQEVKTLELSKEKDVQQTEESLRTAYDVTVRDLERDLTAARREQAKCTVKLRRAERKLSEIERTVGEQEDLVREGCKNQLETSKAHITQIQRERNLLILKTQQDQLIEKRKDARPSPIQSLTSTPSKDFVKALAAQVLNSAESSSEDEDTGYDDVGVDYHAMGPTHGN